MNDLLEYLRTKVYFDVEFGRTYQNIFTGTVAYLSIESGEIGRMQNTCERPVVTNYRVDIFTKRTACDRDLDMQEIYKAIGIVNEDNNGIVNAILCKDSPFYSLLQKESVRFSIDENRDDSGCFLVARVTFSIETILNLC